jgi:hypothetical protein
MLILVACMGEAPAVLIDWTPPNPVEDTAIYQFIDYKTKSSGEAMPEWVTRYDNEGVHGVEGLPEYQDAYVFIKQFEGTSFKALQQWTSGFSISKDFSRMVASRIQSCLTQAVPYYPEREYGSFFQAFIKAASDAVYTGAVQAADFWALKQYFQADGITPDRQVYNFFILVRINKNSLQPQINEIFTNTLALSAPLTKSQSLTVTHLQTTFFSRF